MIGSPHWWVFLLAALSSLVFATWTVVVPYVRFTADTMTVQIALARSPRVLALGTIKSVEWSKGSLVTLVGIDGTKTKLRVANVRPDERDALRRRIELFASVAPAQQAHQPDSRTVD
jgi:hypothetical protein